jgi:cell division protein FtsW (lipid II flippase)
MLALQSFIILGGVTKLIPLTGITLPLVSYGGSSILSVMLLLGILQGVSEYTGRKAEEALLVEDEDGEEDA